MDLGDGYSAIYGQLKEVPYEVGDIVGKGKLVGYIAEPTKYYSVEGSNLYFALQNVPHRSVVFWSIILQIIQLICAKLTRKGEIYEKD